jgi:prepilin-type N-terminal cleavage/methylation domain-containing protein/prepilin-type processing-associated H-X9-DG protein
LGTNHRAAERIMPSAGRRGAFTLIELLVVIAIIAIIAAILFPVFAQAREQAREVVCESNLRQIGTAVRMYVDDYDQTFPIFQAYNTAASGGAPGTPGHLGVEDELAPYTRSRPLFLCPDDSGGPTTNGATYHDFYGSSYRFTSGCFTVTYGSYEDDAPVLGPGDPQVIVTDAMFQYPTETRLMRDEMMPWFSCTADPGGTLYGYCPQYYQQWHPRGGGMVFADGHAKYVHSAAQFNQTYCSPDARSYANAGINAGYYGDCD